MTVRRSGRRRTLVIQVTADASVVVHAPARMSTERVQAAVEARREWISRHVAERRHALSLVPGPGTAPYLGAAYPLRAANGAPTGLTLLRDEIAVPFGTAAQTWRELVRWYRGEADRLVRDRVGDHGERLRLRADRISLRQWRARWGDCQRDGSLRFNWRLVMLPPAAVDYVVVHELVHLREFNHSPRFWRLLSEALPEARAWRLWFNTYGSPYLSWTYSPGGVTPHSGI